MTVRLKIYGENTTRKADLPPLCDSCKHGTRVKGVKRGEDFTNCDALDKTVTFHVTECDAYVQKGSTHFMTFESTAWIRMDESKWATPLERYGSSKDIGAVSQGILKRAGVK